jgi:hypothetical protein
VFTTVPLLSFINAGGERSAKDGTGKKLPDGRIGHDATVLAMGSLTL